MLRKLLNLPFPPNPFLEPDGVLENRLLERIRTDYADEIEEADLADLARSATYELECDL